MSEPRTAIFLIGLPGAGKSTWASAYLAQAPRPTVVVSTDALVEAFAAAEGLDYRAAHRRLDSSKLEARARHEARGAVARGLDLILDRTNLRASTRARFLRLLPPGYVRHAVLFVAPCPVLAARLRERERQGGKVVPYGVACSMLRHYDPPSFAEFDTIEVEAQG